MIWSLAFVRSLSSRLVVWMNTGLPFTSCYRPILSEINPIKRVIVSCIFETQIHGRTCLSLCLQIWLSVARHSLNARMQTMIRLIPIDFFLDPTRSQACEERNGELCAHLWFFAVFRIEVVQIHFPLPTSHFPLLTSTCKLRLTALKESPKSRVFVCWFLNWKSCSRTCACVRLHSEFQPNSLCFPRLPVGRLHSCAFAISSLYSKWQIECLKWQYEVDAIERTRCWKQRHFHIPTLVCFWRLERKAQMP